MCFIKFFCNKQNKTKLSNKHTECKRATKVKYAFIIKNSKYKRSAGANGMRKAKILQTT